MAKKNKTRILRGKIKMVREVVLSRLRIQKALADYNSIIKYIKKNKIFLLDGDVVEIGALMGGGTKKLSRFFQSYDKRVFSIDIFDPDADSSKTLRGESLAKFYRDLLGKRKMREAFDHNTKGIKNLTVLAKNSRDVTFSPVTKLCFSFIDGNHSPDYVEYDFKLIWKHTIPGGIVVFDDYEGDMPQTTQAIKNVIENHQNEIESVDIIEKKRLVFIKKKSEVNNGY